MAFTNDPVHNPIDRIRLITGDVNEFEEGLSDEVYQYVYDKHTQNENKAALECLQYLVNKYANYVTEKAGGLFTKESELYKQYKDLLDSYTKDPSKMLLTPGLPYVGGISKSELEENFCNSDLNTVNTTIQFYK